MNVQDQFTTMVNHLRKQKAKSTDDEGNCLYRGDNGSMCAVGCLIPDDEYTLDMEGRGVVSIVRDFPLNINVRLAVAMQKVHDNFNVNKWEKEFRVVAETRNLTLPPHEEKSK